MKLLMFIFAGLFVVGVAQAEDFTPMPDEVFDTIHAMELDDVYNNVSSHCQTAVLSFLIENSESMSEDSLTYVSGAIYYGCVGEVYSDISMNYLDRVPDDN